MGITLTGLHLGNMGMDMEIMVFPHPNYVLHADTQQAPKVWYQCPSLAYVIETPDGRILWDTGLSADWSNEWLDGWKWLLDLSDITPEVCLEQRLKQVGLGPEDFRYVIQGHLHADHAGGLRLFERAGAEILVHEDEYNHVQQVKEAENFFVRKDWNFLTEKKPTLVYGDQPLSSKVKLVSLPGHTPGTMGLMVELERTGWVLLTDDAMFTHESYGPPAVGSAITWDQGHWGRSIEKIRGLAKEHNAFIFPGHSTTGIKHHSAEETEFRKIEFQPFTPGYVYE